MHQSLVLENEKKIKITQIPISTQPLFGVPAKKIIFPIMLVAIIQLKIEIK
jgi:hypothetical protein